MAHLTGWLNEPGCGSRKHLGRGCTEIWVCPALGSSAWARIPANLPAYNSSTSTTTISSLLPPHLLSSTCLVSTSLLPQTSPLYLHSHPFLKLPPSLPLLPLPTCLPYLPPLPQSSIPSPLGVCKTIVMTMHRNTYFHNILHRFVKRYRNTYFPNILHWFVTMDYLIITIKLYLPLVHFIQ